MKKIYIIPIFVPHLGCPHDCVFCNQRVITGSLGAAHASDVKKTVFEYLTTMPQDAYKEIAFYGGSFTGIPMAEQEALLKAAYEFKHNKIIDGIRISTRPDYISPYILNLLIRYGVTTIELGVQSLDEEVLEQTKRGHTKQDIYRAIGLIRQFDFKLGVQLMIGLPGDDEQKALASAHNIVALKPDFVRIYPAVVLTGTKLADLYRENTYHPLVLTEAVRRAAKMLLIFEQAGIKVIRIGLQPSVEIAANLIAGPFHPAFRELVESEVAYTMMLHLLRRLPQMPQEVAFSVNPRDISIARGQKGANIKLLFEKFNISKVDICPNTRSQRGELVLETADNICYGMQISKIEIAHILNSSGELRA